MNLKLIFISILLLLSYFSTAQKSEKKDSVNLRKSPLQISYGDKGWQFEYNKSYMMQMQWRIQSRYMHHTQDAQFTIPEEDSNDQSFNLQRVRLKVGGYAFQPYIDYYFEYDFPSNNLLNAVLTIKKYKALQFKVGQWKLEYNTERYVSSGKQQLVDRSISNRFFTLDRQIGLMLLGDIFENRAAYSSYNLGIFNGNGRGMQNDDGQFLFLARYQFNLWKRKLKKSFCDLERTQKPEGFIALSYVYNESHYTSFSSNGGGQLPGYVYDENQFFRIQQYNLELMFKYKGFSFSSENHFKDIYNLKDQEYSQIWGGYLMSGYFFSEIISFVPKALELTARYARISNPSFFTKDISEYTVGANWFFNKHLNKLTVDFSYIQNQDFVRQEDNFRFRIQWDISF